MRRLWAPGRSIYVLKSSPRFVLLCRNWWSRSYHNSSVSFPLNPIVPCHCIQLHEPLTSPSHPILTTSPSSSPSHLHHHPFPLLRPLLPDKRIHGRMAPWSALTGDLLRRRPLPRRCLRPAPNRHDAIPPRHALEFKPHTSRETPRGGVCDAGAPGHAAEPAAGSLTGRRGRGRGKRIQ